MSGEYIPKGIGRQLKVSELQPKQLVAFKRPGDPYTVVEVREVGRFAVIFASMGDKLFVQRTGDNLDSLTLDSIHEVAVFEYTPS